MVKLGDYTKDEVEDFTGRIPLLLENCVVGDKIDLNIKFFAQIYSQAMTFKQDIQAVMFERQIKLKCKDNMADLERHATLVLSPRHR